jgi:hypothetical protein
VNPDYQAAIAALANALPSPPRPLPPWAPSVSLLLIQLGLSIVLLCLAVLLAVESWLRVTDTQGNGDEASVVSVTRQAGYIVYEYATTTPDGTRLTERASAPLSAADHLAPGSALRVWPVRSLLARIAGRRVVPEPMRASHRALALPLAGCAALVMAGSMVCGIWFRLAETERRLLSEGELVRGEVVQAEVRTRLVKPRLAIVMVFQGPGGPAETRYVFPSGRSPVVGSGREPRAGDQVWIALGPDDATRSVPWAFQAGRQVDREQLR